MYATLIAQQIGTADPATTGLVEELMRADRTALDDLTPDAFTAAIADALTDARDLAATDQLTDYCAALGIPTPVIS